jgi:general secretion pathway protein D
VNQRHRPIAILTGFSLALVAAPAAALAQGGVVEKPSPVIPKVQEPPVKKQLRNMVSPRRSPKARELEAKLKANAEADKLKKAARDAEVKAEARDARRRDLDKRLGSDRITIAQANGNNKCSRPKGTFLFNVEQEDIRSLLKKIARITCKNYIISEGVKGKNDITIISHREVTVTQAERAFLAALEANNMALIPTVPYEWKGKTYYKYYKVVERKEATTQPLPMYENPGDLPNDDGQVTLLYPLQYAGKDQVEGLLKGMMSKSGDLRDIGGNLLIITDSASNIRRLVSILQKVDVSGSSSRMHIVDIRWAEAQAISGKLTEIFNNTSTKSAAKKGSNDAGGDEVTIDKIIADERTNKLIIICSVRAFKSVRDVIDILDRPDDINSTATQVFVHPLNNADAQKTASTLSSLAQGSKAKSSKGKKAAAATSATLFEGEVKITADESTNALVIVASARDYNALKKVISDLDVRRPQVFIEAAIMEVSINENRRLSLDAYAGVPADIPGFEDPGLGIIANEGGKSLVTASAQTLAARELFNALTENSARLDPTSLTGVVDASTAFDALLGAIAFQGPGIPGTEELFGFTVPSFGFVLNALQSSSNVNILSTPHIMTTDNEKAEISVGERVPVLRGFTSGAGGGGGALGGFGFAQQVSFEDVKLKFTVTPHVNDSGEIRCEIEQEVSDIGGSIAVGGGIEQPIITSRTAKTTVVVRDQQSVVLGGLISDRKTDTESKFPLLGDIPIIGWLFKNWSDTESKTNLMLVITPYVVRNESDFAKIYERKMRERREFVEAFYGRATDYNPYIDYDKKTGPLGKLISTLDYELMRIENGGRGVPGEEEITPETPIDTFDPPAGDAPPPPDADEAGDEAGGEAAEPAGDGAVSEETEG